MSKIINSKNCWQISKASKAKVLIDADKYFSTFVKCALKAKKNIYIAGWDIDSQLQLVRDNDQKNFPLTLRDFLEYLVKQNKELNIHILCWDYSIIFALERETLLSYRLGWKTNKRIHFDLDDEHPVGASHHQKIVVIDDQLAFSGGLDLTKRRWDSTDHIKDDPRRKDPQGKPYPPFHDLQMMVQGEPAQLLGQLFRQRWYRATKQEISKPNIQEYLWPQEINPDFVNVEMGIARTIGGYKDLTETRECQQLYLKSFTTAKKYIYLENQYLTSHIIGQALVKCLKQEKGPEVILVLPRHSLGWLESNTMDVLQAKILNQLKQADQNKRLSIYHPVIKGQGYKKVHSKFCLIDDLFLRIGSANLTNRSMGLDSECDLAIETSDDKQNQQSIITIRNKLLADHLGLKLELIKQKFSEHNKISAVINSLKSDPPSLVPYEVKSPDWIKQIDIDPDEIMLDPEKPARLDRAVDEFLFQRSKKRGFIFFLKIASVFIGIAALALLWKIPFVADHLNLDYLTHVAQILRDHPGTPFYVIGGYVLGGLLIFPVTLLIAATAAVFSPLWGFIYALSGSLASALVTYDLGRLFGSKILKSINSDQLHRLHKFLSQRGIGSLIAVHIIPIAPFSIINLVSGFSKIKFRNYITGTIVGMAPGIAAVTLFTTSLKKLFFEPSLKNTTLFVLVVAALVGAGYWLKKRFSK